MSGHLKAIWIKRAHRGRMDPVMCAMLVAGRGLVGNADQGGRRQVTVLDQRAWDAALEQVGVCVEPAARRANLLTTGVDLANSRGRRLRIGQCELRITGETRPCERMDEAAFGLQAALRVAWRGGAIAEVLTDGEIEVGACVEWIEETHEVEPWPIPTSNP